MNRGANVKDPLGFRRLLCVIALFCFSFLSMLQAEAAPYAYISNMGSNTVSVIDMASNTVSATVPVGTSPYGLAVNPAGTLVYVANSGSGTVSVIDTGSNTVAATVTVGTTPMRVAVHPKGSPVYVVNGGSNSVSIIDAATNTVTETVPVGNQPKGIQVNPAGTMLYVANFDDNTVSVIDTATNLAISTINLSGSNPIDLAVTPDGLKVYVSNYSGGNGSVIDAVNNIELTTIGLGSNPVGVWTNPEGTRVYVTHYGSNNVFMINPATDTVVGAILGFSNPVSIEGNPDGSLLYVVNQGSNTVTVINPANGYLPVKHVTVGATPLSYNGRFIAAPPAVTEGLVSFWRGEGNGFDVVGDNHGSLQGGVSFAAGRSWQAFSLDGTSGYVQVASPTGLPVGNAPRTVTLWFRTPRDLSSSDESALFQYGSAAGGRMFGLITSSNQPGKLYFYGHSADLWGTTTILPDTWYHAAVTYDGTTVTLYLNGLPESSGARDLDTLIEEKGITIGYRSSGSRWQGEIDEVALYNRALSQDEVMRMAAVMPDTTPNTFAFTDVTDSPLSTGITSNTITVSGINTQSPITINGAGCFYRNVTTSSPWTSDPGTVNNSDGIQVLNSSSANHSTTTSCLVTIGGVWENFNVTTIPPSFAITGSAPGGNGIVSCDSPVIEGGSSTCAVVPSSGYHLAGLTDNGGDVLSSVAAGRYVVSNVTGDHTVNATFAADTVDTFQVCPTCQYTSIQDAVNAASEDDETTTVIRLRQGTHNLRTVIDSSMKIRIEGGWNEDFTQRSADPSLTTISHGAFGIITARAGSGEFIHLAVSGVTLSGSSSGSYDIGGGAAAEASDGGMVALNVDGCIITGNGGGNAHGAGVGVLSHGDGSQVFLQMNSTKVVDNHIVFYNGAGIYLQAYDSGAIDASFINSLIADNSAMYGGGLYAQAESGGQTEPGTLNLRLLNSTITNNNAWQYSYYGGGVGGGMLLNGLVGNMNVDIRNSIVWGNTATSADARDIYLDMIPGGYLIVDASHSDINAVYNEPTDPATVVYGDGMLNADPLFVSVVGKDYRLRTGSPAIDAADASTAPLTDIEGMSRPLGAGVDMGAYERVPDDTTPDAFSFTDQTSVPLSAGITSNIISVSGVNAPATVSISGSGCFYSNLTIVSGWISDPGTVNNGDEIQLLNSSSGNYSTTTDCTLTIGGVSDTFSVTTEAMPQYLLTAGTSGDGTGTLSSSTPGVTCAGSSCSGTLTSGTVAIITATPEAGSAFDGWIGCDSQNGNECEVTMNGAKSVTAVFRLVTAIKLLTPNGWATFIPDETVSVQWEAPANVVNFKLKYSLDNGLTWLPITSDTLTVNSHSWTIPRQGKNRKACLVKVVGFTSKNVRVGADVSDAPFGIEVLRLTSPNGGETLRNGADFLITWSTSNTIRPVSKVRLSYSKDQGVTWLPITTIKTGNLGSYSWTGDKIPAVAADKTKCRVKVELIDSAGVVIGSDISDVNFTIGQPL